MKRTPLRRGQTRMKSRPRVKSKAQKLWDAEHDHCWICGRHVKSGNGWLETHHIVPTGLCPRGRDVPTNWFRACGRFEWNCHLLIESTPLVVPAALKKMCDRATFDLPVLVDLHGDAPGAVMLREVGTVIRRLRRKGFEDATPERAVELVKAEIRRATNV